MGDAVLAPLTHLAGDGATLFYADGLADGTAPLQMPQHHGEIHLFGFLRQRKGHVRTLGRHQQTAGVAIQTVDGAEGQGRALALEIAHHAVGEGGFRLARRGVHRQIGRLIHHQQVVVLVHHRQGHLHALDAHRILRHLQPHHLTRVDAVDGAPLLTVHGHTVGDALQLHHHTIGQTALPPQKGLQHLAVVFRRNDIG